MSIDTCYLNNIFYNDYQYYTIMLIYYARKPGLKSILDYLDYFNVTLTLYIIPLSNTIWHITSFILIVK
jgi:hypothetical protein